MNEGSRRIVPYSVVKDSFENKHLFRAGLVYIQFQELRSSSNLYNESSRTVWMLPKGLLVDTRIQFRTCDRRLILPLNFILVHLAPFFSKHKGQISFVECPNL